jgi:hypothetical protein
LGKNIEIEAYNPSHGKQMSPTAAEAAQLQARCGVFLHEGDVETYEVTVQNMMREIEGKQGYQDPDPRRQPAFH